MGAGGKGDPFGAASPSRASRHSRQPEPPDAVYPPGLVGGRPRSLATYAILLIVGLVALVAVAGVLAGAVFAILRLLELVGRRRRGRLGRLSMGPLPRPP